MSIAPAFGDAGPTPIEIDPRPCEFCGLTIDQHRMIDTGEGPEFYCIDVSPDEMTIDELNEAFERESCSPPPRLFGDGSSPTRATDGSTRASRRRRSVSETLISAQGPRPRHGPTARRKRQSTRFGTSSASKIRTGFRHGCAITPATRQDC